MMCLLFEFFLSTDIDNITARYRQQRIRLPYDAPPLSCGHIFQGAVPKRGKGQTVSALVTIEEISLISRWRFMYSSMHT